MNSPLEIHCTAVPFVKYSSKLNITHNVLQSRQIDFLFLINCGKEGNEENT